MSRPRGSSRLRPKLSLLALNSQNDYIIGPQNDSERNPPPTQPTQPPITYTQPYPVIHAGGF